MTSVLTTDETMRSLLDYGDAMYPFACYQDELEPSACRYVDWHWHDKLEFSYVVEGSVICRIGASSIILAAGDGLFINSGTIHRFEAAKKSVLVNYIFSPEFIAENSSLIYRKYLSPFLLSTLQYVSFLQNDCRNAAILRLLNDALHVTSSNRFGNELRVRNLFSELWLLFSEDILNELAESDTPALKASQLRLQRMLAFIHANFNRHITLADIASEANISKSEALRCFRAGIEASPVKYLNEYRLGKAAELLLSSADPITAIAEQVGYDSTGYFCRAFKSKYGLSAMSFRKTKSRVSL